MSNRRLQIYPSATPSFFLVTTHSETWKNFIIRISIPLPFPIDKLFCRWETFLPLPLFQPQHGGVARFRPFAVVAASHISRFVGSYFSCTPSALKNTARNTKKQGSFREKRGTFQRNKGTFRPTWRTLSPNTKKARTNCSRYFVLLPLSA